MGRIQRREVCQLMAGGPGAALPPSISHLPLARRFSQGNAPFSDTLYLFPILLAADAGC